MAEIIEDGAGELTIHQSGGPGFFHVSFSDGGVTVGCSTSKSPKRCFDVVAAVALQQPSLLDALSFGDAWWTVQRTAEMPVTRQPKSLNYPWGPERRIAMLTLEAKGLPPDVVALRVDVGESSWQWEDLSPGGQPAQRSFGGLTDLSIVDAVTAVMVNVGDEWVQANSHELVLQARRFLEEHAR